MSLLAENCTALAQLLGEENASCVLHQSTDSLTERAINIAVMDLNNSHLNCEPRSVVTVDGAPKVDTQRLIKA